MRYTLPIVALAMLAAPVSAQKRAIEYTEFDLPNGLHVILHQDLATPIVAVSVMYHVGSKNEGPTSLFSQLCAFASLRAPSSAR